MAALRYRDEHNKVGYLQKPKASDFLSTSYIRSLELGPPTILATIDETPYTITEDSVRSQLQLADDGGEGAGVAAQAVPLPIPETIPETRPDPNQPQDHLSTPPRQQTSDHIAPVFEHGQRGSFHASPPRSTQAPPAGHTSGAVTVDSNIPPGGASNNPAASSHIPTDVPTGGDFAPANSTLPSRDPFKIKGVAKPSAPVSERTKKQLADERLSEIEAARLEALERERSKKEKS
ncbi:hypothetical protein Tco_0009780 [Tanacetum coccineum]